MAETDVKLNCELIAKNDDGSTSIKTNELHIHLPSPELGYTYIVNSAGSIAQVSCVKIEGE